MNENIYSVEIPQHVVENVLLDYLRDEQGLPFEVGEEHPLEYKVTVEGLRVYMPKPEPKLIEYKPELVNV